MPYRPPPIRHRRVALLTLLLATAGSGCATVPRPAGTAATVALEAAAAAATERATVDTLIARLARRAARRGDRTLDVLLLSGGGQHGAYGAGFLRGWASHPTAPMPTFDLVTGISSGALQAPFALLGGAPWLDTLGVLYREADRRIAPGLDWWFWLRRHGGVVKAARLERAIAEVLTPRLGDSLRALAAEDRAIAVGTTDYDLGVGRTWDLARTLAVPDTGLALTRRVLRTSASLPGIFPTMLLDGHVHADGGIVANAMPVLDLDGYRRLATALRSAGVHDPVTVRLWVVLNVFPHLPAARVTPSSRRAMNARTLLLLFWLQQPQLLERLDAVARAATAEVPGLRVELRHTMVPAALAADPAAMRLFDREWMVRLDSLGYARARSDAPWDRLPSPFVRSDTASGR
jgi:predicted acylesterase/phospholipase RssA